ncbi:MAG TPA: FUSC family protein, partial [Candidatus Dormibacteraeota bacterium]|nr:FUSC family protein [Candidatus Dormibacteraeota bacterium]
GRTRSARAEGAVLARSAVDVWVEAFRVERRGIDVRAGLAGGVATCAPVALGVALDEPTIAVTACFGGLNAALAVPRGALRERVGWGSGASLACCVSVAVGTAVQSNAGASVLAAFALVGLAAFLRTFGPNGGLTGFVIGAIFVITNGIPAGSLDVAERVLWFALGSLGGVVLMVAAFARDAPPPSPDAMPLGSALALGARQLRQAIAGDALLRAHALRLASIVAATTLFYKLLDLDHGYWVPLTVLAVLQPDEHASNVRAVQRAAGTFVGASLIALLTIATGAHWLIIAAQGIAAFWLFALFARGYFWLVVLLTPTALLTVSAVDYQGDSVALQRAGWSALGIVVGLAIAELCWRLAPHLPGAPRGRPLAAASDDLQPER